MKRGPKRGLNWPQRFWDKVNTKGPIVREELGPCYLWKGSSSGGYGYARHPETGREETLCACI